jgi:uncharacterized linocin/CFP29 family protein
MGTLSVYSLRFGLSFILSQIESAAVRLYLQETFVFRVFTAEAAVVLSPSQKCS